MTEIFDLLLVLDQEAVIRDIQHAKSESTFAGTMDTGVWIGQKITDIPDTMWDFSAGTMTYCQYRFDIAEFRPAPELRCVLLRKENLREQLMEAALDLMPDCVQLYDAQAVIQFFNQSCKRLLDIPPQETVEGQRLMDVFAVDPKYSTTLTALRSRSPVRERYDVYKSTTGKGLSTVTSAQPVIKNGNLLGAVALERDMQVTRDALPEYQRIQQTLARHLSDPLSTPKNTRYTFDDLVGSDPNLLLAKDVAVRMAAKDVNIFVQGETGTGKEIFAQGIHALSSRRSEKFIAINCAAFPESLIEGMLFGTVKGAFTGSTDKAGLIEDANHGTLFLDELNSMSLNMQAKLLRVLQEKTLQRVGGTKNIPVDIRVISACNGDAFALTENERLRRDLFYRLASVVVEIPPLRDRMGDLEPLVRHYIDRHRHLSSEPVTKIEPSFWNRLQQHNWPGNVRELFHILNYALSDCEGGVLQERNLPVYFLNRNASSTPPSKPAPTSSAIPEPDFHQGLSALVQEYEKNILQQAYLSCNRNATSTAALLKISRQNFQYYAKKYGLNQG